MGTDFSIRPVGASVVTPAVAPQTPEAAKTAVPTQLPSDKAVTATSKAEPQSDNTDLGHQITIDRAAAEIVYQVVDNRTNLVVSQYPDEARLRARAYLRAQDETKEDAKRQADRHA
jgi:uncharacterized FlaG/YvyC family protein